MRVRREVSEAGAGGLEASASEIGARPVVGRPFAAGGWLR